MSNKVIVLKGYNTGSFIGNDEKFDVVFEDEKNGLRIFEQMLKNTTIFDVEGYFLDLDMDSFLNTNIKAKIKNQNNEQEPYIFIDKEIKHLNFLYDGSVQNFGDLYFELKNKEISPYCFFNIESKKLLEKIKPENLYFDNNRSYLMSNELFIFLKENKLIHGSMFCAYDFDLNEGKIVSDNKLNSAIEYKETFLDDYEEKIFWKNKEKQIDQNIIDKSNKNQNSKTLLA